MKKTAVEGMLYAHATAVWNQVYCVESVGPAVPLEDHAATHVGNAGVAGILHAIFCIRRFALLLWFCMPPLHSFSSFIFLCLFLLEFAAILTDPEWKHALDNIIARIRLNWFAALGSDFMISGGEESKTKCVFFFESVKRKVDLLEKYLIQEGCLPDDANGMLLNLSLNCPRIASIQTSPFAMACFLSTFPEHVGATAAVKYLWTLREFDASRFGNMALKNQESQIELRAFVNNIVTHAPKSGYPPEIRAKLVAHL